MKLVLPSLLMLTAVASAQAIAPPGDESGRTDDYEPRDSTGRKVGRALLAFPRAAVNLVLAPVRLVLWADDRYRIAERAHELFYTESENLSILPRASYESGIGFRLGAQLDWTLPNEDHVRLFAGTGFVGRSDRYAATYSTKLGDRVEAHAGGDFEHRPDAEFFGIGNMDSTSVPPAMPMDAADIAVDTHYKQRLARVAGAVDTRVVSNLHIAAAAAWSDRQRGAADPDLGPPIEMVYAPESLIGFDQYRSVYGEGELKWDTRRAGSAWDLSSQVTTGTLVSIWGGPTWLTVGEDYWRYGTDLQQYIRLTDDAPRVLSVRFHGEAVSSFREDIPFNELPTLGGSRLLRGYDLERFRDRLSAVGTLEYQWDLSKNLFASVFVDSGRVFSSYSNLSLSDLRTGYGVAFELHAPESPTAAKVFRGSIASSVDGGVFFNFYLEPIFAVTPRVERR